MELLEILKKELPNSYFYYFGDYLRNKLLHTQSKEKILITNTTLQDLMTLLDNQSINYKLDNKYPILHLVDRDLVIPYHQSIKGRKDAKYNITSDPDMSLVRFAEQQPFTIDAMYKNVFTNQLFDPLQGKKDLDNKKLRATSQDFDNESLNILKVGLVAAMFNFEPDAYLKSRLKPGFVKYITKDELYELLAQVMSAPFAHKFFEVLPKQVIEQVLPIFTINNVDTFDVKVFKLSKAKHPYVRMMILFYDNIDFVKTLTNDIDLIDFIEINNNQEVIKLNNTKPHNFEPNLYKLLEKNEDWKLVLQCLQIIIPHKFTKPLHVYEENYLRYTKIIEANEDRLAELIDNDFLDNAITAFKHAIYTGMAKEKALKIVS